MCEKLLTLSQTRELMRTAGLTDWRIRQVITIGDLPPHPHGLHTRRLWLKSRVKLWLDTHLSTPQPVTVIPGEECSRPPGVTPPRP